MPLANNNNVHNYTGSSIACYEYRAGLVWKWMVTQQSVVFGILLAETASRVQIAEKAILL